VQHKLLIEKIYLQRFLFTSFLLVNSLTSNAQLNFRQLLVFQDLHIFNTIEYQEPKITWNMSPLIQRDLNESINLLTTGDVTNSEALLTSMIERGDLHWAIYYYRGVANNKMFRLEQAEKDFKSSLVLNDQVIETYLEYGKTLIYLERKSNNKKGNDNLKNAKVQFEKALSINAISITTNLYLAGIEILLNNKSRAEKFLEVIEDQNPTNFQVLYLRGLIELKREKTNKGLAFLNQSLEANPNYIPALLTRIVINEKKDELDLVLADLSKLIQLNPFDVILLNWRGYLQTLKKDYDAAYIDFKKALLGEEFFIDEESFSGNQSSRDKRIDWQECIDYHIKTISILPENDQSRIKKAICLAQIGSLQDALNSLELVKTNKSVNELLTEAVINEQLNNHQKAFNLYSRCIGIDNNIYLAYKKRSIYLGELKRYKEAFDDLDQMEKIKPQNNITNKLRGIYYYNLDEYEKAENYFSDYLKLDTVNQEVLYSLSLTRVALKKYKDAFNDINRLVYLDKKDIYLILFRDIAIKSGNHDIGISFFQNRYSETDISDGHFLVLIASIYADKGEYTLAKSTIQPILEYGVDKAWKNYFKSGFSSFAFNDDGKIIKPSVLNADIIAEYFYVHSKILLSEEKFEQAIELINYAIDTKFEYLEAHYIRAKIYLAFSPEKAREDLILLRKYRYKDSEALFEDWKKPTNKN